MPNDFAKKLIEQEETHSKFNFRA